ncbi:hypothetical protein [Paraburkholderia tropica]|uniref:hypothetical protein n=1 Tax=Paraburkholderia tropica TaxID=92647 RepID=UPI003D279E84
MRYYEITLTPTGASSPTRTWTSHPNGIFDPDYLEVEFDCQVANFATSPQIFTVTIYGVALQDLSQARQFTGMQFAMKGGMKAGLPLANPAQAGLLVAGQVFQAYGNWEGTDMRLDLVIAPSTYTINNPGNIVLNWQAGQTISQALQQTLSIAYPNVPVTANLSGQIVQDFNEVHFCSTLQELCQCIQGITQGYFLGPTYSGVNLTYQNGQFTIWDSTYAPTPIQIAFTDFVGQPTWIDVNTMVCKLVLRADIQLGSVIKMPQGLQNQPGMITSTQQSYPSSNNYQTAFQGTFNVSEIRHIGSSRSPDGASWITVVKCIANNNSANTVSTS